MLRQKPSLVVNRRAYELPKDNKMQNKERIFSKKVQTSNTLNATNKDGRDKRSVNLMYSPDGDSQVILDERLWGIKFNVRSNTLEVNMYNKRTYSTTWYVLVVYTEFELVIRDAVLVRSPVTDGFFAQ